MLEVLNDEGLHNVVVALHALHKLMILRTSLLSMHATRAVYYSMII